MLKKRDWSVISMSQTSLSLENVLLAIRGFYQTQSKEKLPNFINFQVLLKKNCIWGKAKNHSRFNLQRERKSIMRRSSRKNARTRKKLKNRKKRNPKERLSCWRNLHSIVTLGRKDWVLRKKLSWWGKKWTEADNRPKNRSLMLLLTIKQKSNKIVSCQ